MYLRSHDPPDKNKIFIKKNRKDKPVFTNTAKRLLFLSIPQCDRKEPNNLRKKNL